MIGACRFTSHNRMSKYWENENYVRDLQRAAELGLENRQDAHSSTSKLAGSRSAILALIDRLARKSVTQLSIQVILIASIAAFYVLNISTISLDALARLLTWLVVSIGALTYTAHRLYLFRQGFAYNGKSLTWRSHYTATLSVLSTAMGIGAILLTPAYASLSTTVVICMATLMAGISLGLGHLSHRVAAASSSLPAIMISLLAPLFHLSGLSIPQAQQFWFSWVGAIALIGGILYWGNSRASRLISEHLQDHPRHEMIQIRARTKRTSAAYNPFSIAQKKAKQP